MTPTTIPRVLQSTFRKYADQPALMHVVNKEYVTTTYRQLAEQTRRAALGFLRLGLEHGDRVGLLSESRPEWTVADLAMQHLGLVNTAVFATLPPGQLRYLFRDSGCRAILVSTQKQLAKVLTIRNDLPALEHILVFDADVDLPDEQVKPFAESTSSAVEETDLVAELDRRTSQLKPDDLASLIYTSGTTGEPKGVMLSHWNFASNALAALEVIDVGPGDRLLSFLPLNHVFERLVTQYIALFSGTAVAYAESLFTIPHNMLQVRPTVMTAVPRLFETTAGRIRQETQRGPAPRRALIGWALRVAEAWARKKVARQFPGLGLGLAHAVADKLVYTRIRQTFGGEMRLFISGGAPLPADVGYLFHGLGLTLREGYGLTETSPVITVNPGYDQLKFGTVGVPLRGVEVKIAADGEILTRGPHVMQGYWNRPEETAQAIDEEGWFHTGDIGHLDEDGFLVITDRKKNLLVLANGKNVAPAPLESKLRSSPLIAELVLFGDGQKNLTALIVPDFDQLRRALEAPDIAAATNEELADHSDARQLMQAEIRRLSTELADFEKVRKFALLPHEFTVEAGELTPTLKVKRNIVKERYADVLKSLAE